MKTLVFAGALRTDSANKKFAREAARLLTETGHGAEFLDMKDYAMPLYDGDIEASSGIPEATQKMAAKIAAVDAVIISTPEYNGSIPGVLKNMVDWLSRVKPMPLAGKSLLILAASPGALGGVRVLWHVRQPFEALGMHVFPNMLGLSDAYNAFDGDGRLKDDKKLKILLEQFVSHVDR